MADEDSVKKSPEEQVQEAQAEGRTSVGPKQETLQGQEAQEGRKDQKEHPRRGKLQAFKGHGGLSVANPPSPVQEKGGQLSWPPSYSQRALAPAASPRAIKLPRRTNTRAISFFIFIPPFLPLPGGRPRLLGFHFRRGRQYCQEGKNRYQYAIDCFAPHIVLEWLVSCFSLAQTGAARLGG